MIEKLDDEAGIQVKISDNNRLVIKAFPGHGDEPSVIELSKKELTQLIFELNELAIKMK